MIDEQAVVLDIENHINSMKEEDRLAVRKTVSRILALEKEFGTVQLGLAIALIGARLSAGIAAEESNAG